MNASEFVGELRKKVDLSKAEISRLVDETVTVITEQLQQGNTITIQNLGSLEVKKRAERISVNPVSGKKLLIPPKLVVGYKASPTLKEKMKENPQP
ncbi:MAG: HU family DNA-binding protein [Dysgonamonadaceae bacterium]|jgi:DNA-binding protein HU-beta|nr:HU family DNA-binding protein [Dysgonamonadaceae bacterium]